MFLPDELPLSVFQWSKNLSEINLCHAMLAHEYHFLAFSESSILSLHVFLLCTSTHFRSPHSYNFGGGFDSKGEKHACVNKFLDFVT